MRVSRRSAVVAGIAAVVALGLVLLWFRDASVSRERAVRHDSVSAWLTCHAFLRDSVPEATLAAAPWEAAQQQVRQVEETTYFAAGTAALQGDERRAAEFECLLEWTDGGWRLHSLNAVVVPLAP